MTLLPVRALFDADLRALGFNVLSQVRQDRHDLAAINRSLALHQEAVSRLHRRARTRRRAPRAA